MGTLTPAQPAGRGHRSKRCAGSIDLRSRQEGSSLQAIKPRLGGRPHVLINALLSTTWSPSPQRDKGRLPAGELPGAGGTNGDTQLRPCLSPAQITAPQGREDRDRTALGERLTATELRAKAHAEGVPWEALVPQGGDAAGTPATSIPAGGRTPHPWHSPSLGAGGMAHLGGTCGGRRASGNHGAGHAGGARPAA